MNSLGDCHGQAFLLEQSTRQLGGRIRPPGALYMLMLASMLAYGFYFGAANSLQQLAADAARISIAGLHAEERDKLVGSYLDRHAGEYMLLQRQHLTYAIGEDPADPTQYRVVLRYDAIALPIWNLYTPLPIPNRVMAYGATIRQGGL